MRPPDAAAVQRDVLLATKLHVPQPRPGFLPRPRLTERLTEATASELVLVCTPAGFGKTSLLADWARHSRSPVAWLSLDEADNDPARFWRHVTAALDRVRPGVAEQVAGLLGPPTPPSFQGLVTALINELAAQPDRVLLVLDDYHLVDAEAVHGSLGFLVEHLPPGLRLLVASRADPPLPLARLRVRGQLAELRERDLRFTAEEAAVLLREAVGSELAEGAVAALVARTEGWAAGLQLAILSLRAQPDVPGFVAGFSGSHRWVLDYLAEEVLDRQPEPVREFLLETSVLERLSGPLCEAVTGHADSQQLLEQAERANLFLVPLDEERRWWRFHHLFADLLRARLAQERPERLPALHRNAAGWCEQHGLADDAVRHALAAGDPPWAARLIEQHADALLRRSEDATLRRWLHGLPAELVRSRPRLCLAQALAAITAVRLEAAGSLLDDAERALAARVDQSEEPFAPSVGRAASQLANAPAMIALYRGYLAAVRGDAEQASAFVRCALAELDEGESMLDAITRVHLAQAEWLHGRLAEAERAFASSIAQWRAAGERFWAVRVSELLGHVQRAQGRLGAALATYRQVLEVTAAPGRPVPPAAGIGHVAMAEVLYERGELQAALDHAVQGVGLCRQLGYGRLLVTGLAVLAWIRQAQGDALGALEAIAEAERVELSPAVVGLLNPGPALLARLALARGEVAGAVRWVQERGLGIEDAPSYPREGEYLVLARVLIAQQAPEQAVGLLERLHDLAAAQQRMGSLIEIRAVLAPALAASGNDRAALAALAEALALACPEGYVRVFVDEGAPMASLLGRLAAPAQQEQLAEKVPPGYLARLLAAFPPAATRPAHLAGRAVAGPLPGLVEPLTERELEVLALLATGRSNQQIAQELVVALDTVKKHVSHVLDKLGVANRTQAVARARELQLLQ